MGSYLLSVLVVLVITPRIPGFIYWVVDLEVLGPSSWILDLGSQVLGPGIPGLASWGPGSSISSPGVLGPAVRGSWVPILDYAFRLGSEKAFKYFAH